MFSERSRQEAIFSHSLFGHFMQTRSAVLDLTCSCQLERSNSSSLTEEAPMLKPIETHKAPMPFSNYSQGIAVDAGARYLFVAGQVGARASDNHVPESAEEQHELAWENVLAILAANDMDHTNIVDAHVYITDRSQIPLYRQTRDRMMRGHKPAATLLVVAGLADPRLVVEVSVVAAAPAR